jgi:hypothetical protein
MGTDANPPSMAEHSWSRICSKGKGLCGPCVAMAWKWITRLLSWTVTGVEIVSMAQGKVKLSLNDHSSGDGGSAPQSARAHRQWAARLADR